MSFKKQYLDSAAVLAVAMTFATTAYAQDAGSAAATASVAPNEDGGGIADIVVTAQRREERLQDVPISVAAFDAKLAEAAGIVTVRDIGLITPGLEIQFENGAVAPTLRGISTANTAGDESPIALYVDGVYQPTLTAGSFALNNIARIEVLKGPQGTLFGRNAAGGVVQIITRDPTQETHVDASVGYANYDTLTANLYATTGLGADLAGDIALYYNNQGDGWGRNLTTGGETYKTREFAARSKFLWEPGDATRVSLSLSYDKRRSGQGTNQRVLPPYRGLDGQVQDIGFYNTVEDIDGNQVTAQYGTALNIRHEMDWATIVSTTSYQRVHSLLSLDLDHTPLPLITPYQRLRQRTITQELQLLSPAGSPISWIAGLYYFNDDAANKPLKLTGLAFAPLTFINFFARQKTQSYAAFGELTVPLGETTNVTAGLRYTRDRRALDAYTTTDFGVTPGSQIDDKRSFPKLTYRLTLDHKFAPDFLVYATASRGFKSGLFNITSPSSPVVRPETLDAYEIGFKSDFLDRRLRINASAFWYDFEGIQLQRVVNATTELYNAAKSRTKGVDVEVVVAPVEGLTLRGSAEYLNAKYRRFDQAAFFTPNPAPFGGLAAFNGNASGNRMVRAPKWTATASAQYELPTAIGTFAFAGNYSYNSGYFWDPQSVLRQPQTDIFGASIKWTSLDEHLDIRVWGRNLSKERYFSYVAAQSTGYTGSSGEPRTYGVTAGMHF